ncbi:hypothetical protein [Butyrivibrio sp. FC2001]|uniref:hypothetical protein n=1 Tax=Butyrivibrio sp. FC2001 TaxID=1280671 RepID=UPI0003FDB255|nr:hypothetical protein [Butyrivibrio sp. FC2001]
MKNLKPKTLQLNSTTKTLSATFYTEQLPDGEEALYNNLQAISPTDLIIIAIKHSGTGGGKDHYHVIMKKADRNGSFNVKSCLNKLHIHFRPIEDKALLANHGIETTGNFSSCLSYILHQSYSAQRQHKKTYSISNLISNISTDEIKGILEGYSPTSSKLTADDMIDAARNAGYNLSDFEKMLDEMNIKGLTQSMETKMRNAYYAGAEKVVREGRNVNRLCIFIRYDNKKDNLDAIEVAVKEALSEKNTIHIDGNRYETKSITPTTNAIIFVKPYYWSEIKNIVSKLNSTKVELLRSNSIFDLIDKKTIWSGEYIVYIYDLGKDYNVFPHCFDCSVKDGKLYCTATPSNIKDFKEPAEIRKKYDYFKERFNEAFSNYSNHSNAEFFEGIND